MSKLERIVVDQAVALKLYAVFLVAVAAAACNVERPPETRTASETGDDLLTKVHPELREFAGEILESDLDPSTLSDATLETFRASFAIETPTRSVPIEEVHIPSVQGAPDVRVLVANVRRDRTDRPAVFYIHGGGYVLGSVDYDIAFIEELASELDCVVVAVEYRLAPETQWSDSLEDNYAGLKWLHDSAVELGVDPARIAIVGNSAGGGHAALLAIAARDRGEVPLVLQSLIYPMLDDRTGTSRQVPAHVGTLVWTAKANRYGWRSFLGQEPGQEEAPEGAVPARVADLSGLAPAFIAVGDLDLFVDESISYARRLEDAGVSTELVVIPGAFHAFDMLAPETRVSTRFKEAKFDALRRAFGQAIAP